MTPSFIFWVLKIYRKSPDTTSVSSVVLSSVVGDDHLGGCLRCGDHRNGTKVVLEVIDIVRVDPLYNYYDD